jgi:asparagine synthase (glutamine-hydrolysing)
MCGLAGFIADRQRAPLAERMQAALTHRGPDDQGTWGDPAAGIWFAHRRLAIIDRTAAGHQPMASHSGRYVAAYNGEIYNHAQLRERLMAEGRRPKLGWRGHSDTETLLECIAAWGLAATLTQSVGMFALALWDREEQTLHLARDRFGEKPLYYGWVGRDLLFGSELKAIRAHPDFAGEIDRRSLELFAARGYVPAPLSIYRRLYKLEPGCILSLSRDAWTSPLDEPPAVGASGAGLRLERYWSYLEVVRAGLADPILDEQEALGTLGSALAEAVGGQAIADVPVGCFLSGGIDSSAVVAFYQKQSSIPVRTFSIGFEDSAFNEAGYARAVARRLGTVHHERYVTAAETREVIPLLPTIYDEPFADSSQIPTYLVSHFAREQVTVALSGDGGDELFGGYRRHFAAPRLWSWLQKIPAPVRRSMTLPLSRLPAGLWNLSPARHHPEFGSKIQKALRVAGTARSFGEIYSSFIDQWAFEASPVGGGGGVGGGCAFDFGPAADAGDAVRSMYCDAVTYLPDDILCKVDRAAMAVSLETRVPFLDHRLAAVAARIPVSMKIRNGHGKHILRELLYREAPRALFERPKAGFAIPVGDWLKGPLRPWAEELLEPCRMGQEGYFDPVIVARRWSEHLAGRRDSTAALWAVLMFQAWLRQTHAVEREPSRPALRRSTS